MEKEAQVRIARVRSKQFLELEQIFSEAEALVLDVERYCKVNALEHPLEHLRSCLKVVGLMVDLKNLDYYERSLSQKKKDSQRFFALTFWLSFLVFLA